MDRATAVFMIGAPASGKSRTAKALFPELEIVDCDSFKEQHPDYDPKNPSTVHEWSKVQCARHLATVMGAGSPFVYDSTGTNAEKLVHLIKRSQELGYRAILVYVTCSLATSIRRNAERARTVDESIVREKHTIIATSFEIVARYADEVRVINND